MRAIAFCVLLAACRAFAAPADPDPAFGSGGFVTANFSVASGLARIHGLVQQPDGKVVAAGHAHNGTSRDFALARFNSDGSLDSSFGTSGVVVTAMAGRDDFGQAVALQADGKIVVAGYVAEEAVAGAPRPRFAVARYLPDGSLDHGFGIGGKVLTSVGEPDASGPMDGFAHALAIQADGKILVGGYAVRPAAPVNRAVVVRYLDDGSVDTSFGTDGKAIATFAGMSHGFALAVQADGKILLAGRAMGPSVFDLAVARFDAQGALDGGFGSGGLAQLPVGQHAEVQAVLVQSDGGIVLVGPNVIARLTDSGQPDASFNGTGVVLGKGGRAALLESDGRIVVAGETPNGLPGQIGDFRLYRLLSDGGPDASFGNGGEVVTPVEPAHRDGAYALLRSADGKYLAGGLANHEGLVERFAVVRYSSGGAPDASWGSGGIAHAYLGNSDDRMNALAVLPDGKVVAAGETFNAANGSYDLAVARFLPNGAPDTSFGTAGRVVTALSPFNDSALAVAVQPDGKIVVAGYTFGSGAGTSDMLVARYLGDGNPDTGFGGTGAVLIDFQGGADQAAAIALRPDGRIVAGGSAAVGGWLEFAAAQLLPNGVLDPDFGDNGIAHVSVRSSFHDFAQGMALQADGAIVLAGKSEASPFSKSLALVRLAAGGAPDPGFGMNGIVMDLASAANGANAVVIQPDGKIVVGGHQPGGVADECLVRRYRPDGTPDASFGSEGETAISPGCGTVYALALQPNGKLLGVGAFNTSSFGFSDLPVFRLNADGTRDAAFGSNGARLFSVGRMNDAGLGIALDRSGRIVIGGAGDDGASRDFLLVRLEGNPLTAKPADLNGDGNSDILWRNAANGQSYLFPMQGKAISGAEGYLRTVPDLAWKVAGIGDFDGDGRADILWRHSASGANYIFFMSGNRILREGYLRAVPDQDWQVAGIGDFNADGKDDIFWRNAESGENYLFLMNGAGIAGEGYTRTVAGPDWQVHAVGDFDGDGKADLFWRHASSGQNYVYLMNGTGISGEGYTRTVADANWQVKGAGDFDGDGKADIVWRHATSGQNYLFPMSGTAIKPSEGYLRTVLDPAWTIAAVGDYDGDARSDLLWRNSATGQNYLYPMDGTAVKPTEGYVRSVAPGAWGVVRQ